MASEIMGTSGDLFEGLSLDFNFADSDVAHPNASSAVAALDIPELSQNVASLVDVENENKRVRINRSKHKRVHSDPNVFTRFVAEMNDPMPAQHVDRVDLRDYGMPTLENAPPIPDPLNISVSEFGLKPPLAGLTPPSLIPTTYRAPAPAILEGMDDFLQSVPLNEVNQIALSSGFDSQQQQMSLGFESRDTMNFHNSKIQQHVDQIKTKRKRAHQRHHSNPVGLLHNLDQVRQIAQSASTESNRKQYKCGKCGKPKVGHVCTMPDQRNNHSQVDLQITKGLKAPEASSKFITVKKVWIPTHPDFKN